MRVLGGEVLEGDDHGPTEEGGCSSFIWIRLTGHNSLLSFSVIVAKGIVAFLSQVFAKSCLIVQSGRLFWERVIKDVIVEDDWLGEKPVLQQLDLATLRVYYWCA